MDGTILCCENLRKTFSLSRKQQKAEHTAEKVRVAVNDLSFEAREGEIYGLLGSNGAGKTTTLRMISTLIRPTGGKIKIMDKDISHYPDFARANVGFLTSELRLEDYFTPSYLFDYFSALHGVEENVKNMRKRALFEKFGIDKFAEVKVGALSTGMKQKTSLAISLVHDPKLIVFDEPTNGLDVLTARAVTDFLQELRAEGKAIVISTHVFSVAERICDRVGIIVKGSMALEGTLGELTRENCLEDVFFNVYKEAAL